MTNNLIYLSGGPRGNDLFFKHEVKGSKGFKPSHLHFKFMAYVNLCFKMPNLNS